EPLQSFDPCPCAALALMQRLRVMIKTDANLQPTVMLGQQPQKAFLDPWSLHGPHGVGQHQDLKAASQRVSQHRYDVRVHERLAPGEADFPSREMMVLDLIEVCRDL